MPILEWGSDKEKLHEAGTRPHPGQPWAGSHASPRPPCPLGHPHLSMWNANSLAICLLSLPACSHRHPWAVHEPWCT